MGEQSGPSDEDIDVESTNEEPTPTTKEEFDSQQNAEEDQPKTTGADSSSDEWQYLDNTDLDEAYSLQNSLSIDECNGILEPRVRAFHLKLSVVDKNGSCKWFEAILNLLPTSKLIKYSSPVWHNADWCPYLRRWVGGLFKINMWDVRIMKTVGQGQA
ncbi:hypothetical protein AnigIFM63309_000395 [Aspergillus niger]|nr:hypothetical protein AnigIFM63309_000395 [Aspergillus niger]